MAPDAIALKAPSNEDTLFPSISQQDSPFRLLSIVTFVTPVASGLGLLIFDVFFENRVTPAQHYWLEALFVSVVAVTILFPVLYYFSYRPMRRHEIQMQAAQEKITRQYRELQLLSEAETERRQATEALAAASQALTYSLSPDIILNTLLDHLGSLVPFERARIMLPQSQQRLITHLARGYEDASGQPAPLFAPIELEHAPHLRDVFTAKRAISADRSPLQGDAAVSWLGLPLLAEGKVIGLCALEASQTGAFSEHHRQMAEALVNQAAIAYQNAWLFEQVRAGHERQQLLSRRLVEIQEAERRYIARELHDEAGQALASLMIGLMAVERVAGQSTAVMKSVSELRNLVDQASVNLHRLVGHLRPVSLDHLGLIPALQQFVRTISEKDGLNVQFETVGLDGRLPADLETAIFRIVQEALTNVVRHAQATHADIQIVHRDGKLIIIVEDDGVGFDPERLKESDRMGMLGMYERTEMLGGTFAFESSPTAGTTLMLEIPYDPSNSHS